MDWRQQAACRVVDPEVFFPTGQRESLAVEIAQAKDICRSCAVSSDCLRWALGVSQIEGIWGGMTMGERRSLVRRRRAERQRAA